MTIGGAVERAKRGRSHSINTDSTQCMAVHVQRVVGVVMIGSR